MTPEEVAAQIVSALRCSSLIMQLNSIYEDLLKRTVFPHPVGCHDRKDLRKYQRLLLDDETCAALLVVWRESSWVPEEHLMQAGLNRHFSGEFITAYGLAKKLAESTNDLAKVNSRLQSAAIAAEAYGLVERKADRAKNRPLIATARLNELVLEMARIQLELISKHPTFVSLRNVDKGLQQQ